MPQSIEPGAMVFLADGKDPAGAVRGLDGPRHLVVNIENGGDFSVSADAIRDVHEGKVILDVDHLPQAVRQALRHPHDAEYPDSVYAATDPKEGALKD